MRFNFFVRLFLFTFIVAFLRLSCDVFADEVTPTPSPQKSWLLDATSYEGVLFAGGHTDDLTIADEFQLNSTNTVTVYNPTNYKFYIFTATPNAGTHQYRLINYRVGDWETNPNYAFKNLTFSQIANWNQPFAGMISLFGWDQNEFYFAEVDSYYAVSPAGEVTVKNPDFIASSAQELYDILSENNWEKPNPGGLEGKDPYFYIKTEGIKYNSDIEYTITWDLEESWASSSDYIQIYVSKENGSAGDADFFNNFNTKKAVSSSDQYPIALSGVATSFTLQQLRNMYLFGGGFLDHNFYLYIRVVDSDGNPLSSKWFYFQITKMIELNSAAWQVDDGSGLSEPDLVTHREDGVTQYIDDRPVGDNTTQDGSINPNGSSVSPSASEAGINNYTPTTSQELGINYGTSLNDLSSNLGGLVNSISNLPTLLATVCSWLPAWLITLIAVSIGMVVVIGSVKLILR